jgi:hypothetical protein
MAKDKSRGARPLPDPATRAETDMTKSADKTADQRFFALRESGYTGPIDQDGDKAGTGPAAEILAALAAMQANLTNGRA